MDTFPSCLSPQAEKLTLAFSKTSSPSHKCSRAARVLYLSFSLSDVEGFLKKKKMLIEEICTGFVWILQTRLLGGLSVMGNLLSPDLGGFQLIQRSPLKPICTAHTGFVPFVPRLCHRLMRIVAEREWWATCWRFTLKPDSGPRWWRVGRGPGDQYIESWCGTFHRDEPCCNPLSCNTASVDPVFDVVGLAFCSTPWKPPWMNPLQRLQSRIFWHFFCFLCKTNIFARLYLSWLCAVLYVWNAFWLIMTKISRKHNLTEL